MIHPLPYVVGVFNPEDKEVVRRLLKHRGIECSDYREHQPRRAEYMMTPAQSKEVLKLDKVSFVNYAEKLKRKMICSNADLLTMAPLYRYSTPVKCYRDNTLPPFLPDGGENWATGWHLPRIMSALDPYKGTDDTVLSRIPQGYTGKNVDIIVGDEGCYAGHVTFQNNVASDTKPAGYVGGNPLPGNGTCDILDIVLDGPYYIDPEWFDADPSSLLETRWDGTSVPTELAAKEWWSDSTKRSPSFSGFPEIEIPSGYSRQWSYGLGLDSPPPNPNGDHGTQCASLAYGLHHGAAYNANKWVLNHYGNNGAGPSLGFDLVHWFHTMKPNNNPTVLSSSWGFQNDQVASFGKLVFLGEDLGGFDLEEVSPDVFAWVSAEDGVTQSKFLFQNGASFQTNFGPHETEDAAVDMVDAGVIWLVSAGNGSQMMCDPEDPHFSDTYAWYGSLTSQEPWNVTLGFWGDVTWTGYLNRGSSPQCSFYRDSQGIPTKRAGILIGVTDREHTPDGDEWLANYSTRGSAVSVYAPGDDTLAAGKDTGFLGEANKFYIKETAPNKTNEDFSVVFNGTSSACPIAAGLVALWLEQDPTLTQDGVRAILENETPESVQFYTGDAGDGTETITDHTSDRWLDVDDLRGGKPRLLYNVKGYEELT